MNEVQRFVGRYRKPFSFSSDAEEIEERNRIKKEKEEKEKEEAEKKYVETLLARDRQRRLDKIGTLSSALGKAKHTSGGDLDSYVRRIANEKIAQTPKTPVFSGPAEMSRPVFGDNIKEEKQKHFN